MFPDRDVFFDTSKVAGKQVKRLGTVRLSQGNYDRRLACGHKSDPVDDDYRVRADCVLVIIDDFPQ